MFQIKMFQSSRQDTEMPYTKNSSAQIKLNFQFTINTKENRAGLVGPQTKNQICCRGVERG